MRATTALATAVLILSSATQLLAEPMTFLGTSADGTLISARDTFRAAVGDLGGSLSFQGFNDFFPEENATQYFQLNGAGLLKVTENSVSEHVVSTAEAIYVTEGARAIRMSINNPSTYTFHFDRPLNAIGIDVSDVDFDSGELQIVDNLGNMLLSFNSPSSTAQDVFFGLINTQAYDTITIVAAGNPNKSFGGFIGFDNLEFGVAPQALDDPIPTPEPASVLVWALVASVAMARYSSRSARARRV
jgi:hypothetical protein